MRLSPGRIVRGAFLMVLALAVSAGVRAQESKSRQGESNGSSSKKSSQRVAGVILKVEKIDAKDGKSARRRLTINTEAVWRDWARDQLKVVDRGPASKDAAKGKDSIATQGQPVEKLNLAVVEVGEDTNIETRFRPLDDETSAGEKNPAGVNATGKGSDQAKGTARAQRESSSSSDKAVRFGLEDLKPALFVEADYRRGDGSDHNRATRLAVIRPIEKTAGVPADRGK